MPPLVNPAERFGTRMGAGGVGARWANCPPEFFTKPFGDVVTQVRAVQMPARKTTNPTLEMTMNTFKTFAIRTLALTALAAAAMSSANAGVFVYRTRVIAPVVVAPVVAPVVAAPVVVAPVYVPTCTIVSVPFVNAYTGVTYLVPRRVCN
jgi:hypothetical protein